MGVFGNKGSTQRHKFRKELQAVLTEKKEAGEIDHRDYRRAMRASRRNRNIEVLMSKARDSGLKGSEFKGDFSWDYIVDWIKDNWLTILFNLLKIALLFADTPAQKAYYGTPMKGNYCK